MARHRDTASGKVILLVRLCEGLANGRVAVAGNSHNETFCDGNFASVEAVVLAGPDGNAAGVARQCGDVAWPGRWDLQLFEILGIAERGVSGVSVDCVGTEPVVVEFAEPADCGGDVFGAGASAAAGNAGGFGRADPVFAAGRIPVV